MALLRRMARVINIIVVLKYPFKFSLWKIVVWNYTWSILSIIAATILLLPIIEEMILIDFELSLELEKPINLLALSLIIVITFVISLTSSFKFKRIKPYFVFVFSIFGWICFFYLSFLLTEFLLILGLSFKLEARSFLILFWFPFFWVGIAFSLFIFSKLKIRIPRHISFLGGIFFPLLVEHLYFKIIVPFTTSPNLEKIVGNEFFIMMIGIPVFGAVLFPTLFIFSINSNNSNKE